MQFVNENPEINMFDLLGSSDGHTLFLLKLRQQIKDQPWCSIDHMLRALERNQIYIPVFATIYSVAPDGEYLSFNLDPWFDLKGIIFHK